jgi:hypothetical protein
MNVLFARSLAMAGNMMRKYHAPVSS